MGTPFPCPKVWAKSLTRHGPGDVPTRGVVSVPLSFLSHFQVARSFYTFQLARPPAHYIYVHNESIYWQLSLGFVWILSHSEFNLLLHLFPCQAKLYFERRHVQMVCVIWPVFVSWSNLSQFQLPLKAEGTFLWLFAFGVSDNRWLPKRVYNIISSRWKISISFFCCFTTAAASKTYPFCYIYCHVVHTICHKSSANYLSFSCIAHKKKCYAISASQLIDTFLQKLENFQWCVWYITSALSSFPRDTNI